MRESGEAGGFSFSLSLKFTHMHTLTYPAL